MPKVGIDHGNVSKMKYLLLIFKESNWILRVAVVVGGFSISANVPWFSANVPWYFE